MDFENSKDFPNKTRPTVYKSAFPRKKNLFKRRAKFCHVRAWKSIYLLTAEYETDPDFLRFFKIFQSNMSVCLIISVFCKSFELICEPEITPVSSLQSLTGKLQGRITTQGDPCSHYRDYRVLKQPFKPCGMNCQFPVHITWTRTTISTLLKQGKKCNQNRRKLYSLQDRYRVELLHREIPVFITGNGFAVKLSEHTCGSFLIQTNIINVI